MTKEVLEIT